jgi:hypothetical protein
MKTNTVTPSIMHLMHLAAGVVCWHMLVDAMLIQATQASALDLPVVLSLHTCCWLLFAAATTHVWPAQHVTCCSMHLLLSIAVPAGALFGTSCRLVNGSLHHFNSFT